MLKIEEFAERNLGITLQPFQLELIASIAARSPIEIILRPSRSHGIKTAQKVAIAYLQDGLTEAEQ